MNPWQLRPIWSCLALLVVIGCASPVDTLGPAVSTDASLIDDTGDLIDTTPPTSNDVGVGEADTGVDRPECLHSRWFCSGG